MTDQDTLSPVQKAEAYVRSFQEGREFRPPSEGLIQYGSPDTQALFVLERNLLEGTAPVRSNVVELLADMGAQCADPTNTGLAWIKDRRIIRALTIPGMTQSDVARERAMKHLRDMVLREDLDTGAQEIMRAVEVEPTEDGLLLLAKAQPPGGSTLLKKIAGSGDWSDDQAFQIALAASGDEAVEAGFLQALRSAIAHRDCDRFAEAVNTLSLIGTASTLRAVAEQLRTPLVEVMPRHSGRSMRLVVLEGLMYNYPDRIELYPDNVIEEEDYIAAEQFCERELGVIYSTPRPPFLTIGLMLDGKKEGAEEQEEAR